MNKKLTIFDCLKEIIVKKEGNLCSHSFFNKIWDNYMITRYLSMDKRFEEISFYLNKYQSILSKEQFYKLCVKVVPQYSNSFIKYIKKS